MDFDKVLKERRSIKKFKKKIVSDGDVSEIVNAAQYAPNAGNLQNWEFVVVKDPDIRDKVTGACKNGNWIKKADFLVVVLNDDSDLVKHFGEIGKKWAVQNCAVASQNILLKATDLKVGSTWVGGYDEGKLKEVLQIPEEICVEAILVFGYPDEKPALERDDIRSKLSFNLYGKESTLAFPLAQNPKVKKRGKFLK